MRLNKEEILKFVKDNNVKSINLSFCDIYGKEKNIVIMPEELRGAFELGVPFNVSEVKNFGEGVYRNLLLHPEYETFSDMPWRQENDRAIRMFCSMTYVDGTPFTSRGTKSLLKKAIEEADKAGYEFFFSTEIEFYLFKRDENGEPTKIPYDKAGMFDIPPRDQCERIRRNVCLALAKMDVFPNNTYHERGPAQNKITFSYNDPLTAGNNITTLKAIVKNEAANNGLYADFSPKPLPDKPGNGFHIGVSIRANDGTDHNVAFAIAGMMEHIGEMTAFLNPFEESYKRLGKLGAPRYVSWTSENREQLFRVPETVGKYRLAELRSADSMVNPFLAFALLIFASLDGIEKQIPLPPIANFDMDTADEATLAGYKKLPNTFEEACQIAQNSEFIKKYLHEDLIKMYLNK